MLCKSTRLSTYHSDSNVISPTQSTVMCDTELCTFHGELQRSKKLMLDSNKLAQSASVLQLVYLQSLNKIASDKTNTIVFPLPLEMVGSFLENMPKNLKSQIKTKLSEKGE